MTAPHQCATESVHLISRDGSPVDLHSVLGLMDAWSDAALLVSQDRRVLATNACLRRFLGVHPDTVVGRDAYDLLFPEGGAPEDCPIETAVSEGLSQRTHTWERRDTGRWIEATVTRTPFLTPSKKLVFLFLQRDVTEREEVLRQSKLRTQELEALRDLLLLDPDVPLNVLLQLVLERLVDLSWLGVQRRGIAYLADEHGNLFMEAAVGLSPEVISLCTQVPRGRCLCGRAAAEGQLVYAAVDGEGHTRQHRGMQSHGHYCVPVTSEARLLGMLTFYLPAGHRYSRREAAFLRSAASVVAVMVERAHTRQALADQHRRVADTLDASVRTMGRMLEVKDSFSAAHQQRVADLSRALGTELGLDAHRLRGLVLASSLTDIGKVGVPRELLTRDGPLDPEEELQVRAHVDIGHSLLAAADFPWPMGDMVRQHHEAWDGSGYPRGLAGEDILLEARIIAVADTVAAMASNRPHRRALGLAAGGVALLEGRGTRFDPDVVDAFMRLMERDALPEWLTV